MSPKRIKVIGLMSGTSLDGVDAAIIETDGERIYSFGPAQTFEYSADERAVLTDTMAAAVAWNFDGPPPNIFSRAEAIVDAAHRRAVDGLMATHDLSADDIDLIGYHGQTVLHRGATPARKGDTLQIGNGERLRAATGLPVVFDFRSADVAAGGQGAPLAPIYHKALCDHAGLTGRIAVVNIGGVSNVTLIDGDAPLVAGDCGPGNGPLDSFNRARTGTDYDAGGALSLSALPDFALIDEWLRAPFFARLLPRSADRYEFDVLGDVSGKSDGEGAATLAAFCALSIARDLSGFDPQTIIICGGGRHNRAIMYMLQSHYPGDVVSADSLGWDGDALEAQAFAYMAARTLRGLPISFPGTTGVGAAMVGGVVKE